MISRNTSILILFLIVVSVWTGGRGVRAAASRYFPDTGAAAVHQRGLELSGGAVVVVIALQPGYEDLPLLAHLRMASGAQGAVVYLTNGESTPGDDGGRTPLEVAAARREEAYAALRTLQVDARFLNVPDPGVCSTREALAGIWQPDTVVARLVVALRYYRPDVVVIAGDLRGDELSSLRQQTMTDLALRSVKALEHVPDSIDRKKTPMWRVSRVYRETEGRGKERTYDRVHPLLRSSYRAMAIDAARAYESLRLQLKHWMDSGDRRYAMILPRGAQPPSGMVSGLPIVGAKVQKISRTVRALVEGKNGGKRAPTLREVARTIDTVDVYLARYRQTVTGDDLRLLAFWKNGLEALRCALLDVKVQYGASDSLITKNQLIHLRFKSLSSRTSGKQSKVFFPQAIDHTWGINESTEYQFDLLPPVEFRILTPRMLKFTMPGPQFGLKEPLLRTRFSFNIVHRDSLPERDFIYKGDLQFRTGPRRSFEILTPIVRAVDGAPLIFRLQNFSRDPYEGTISITDSLAESAGKKIFLPPKDFVLVDTLRVSLRQRLPVGDHWISVSLSGGDQAPFILRSFEATVDSQARIALVTSMTESPVAHALDRLGSAWSRLKTTGEELRDLERWNVIIIDRDALAGVPTLASQQGRFVEWLRRGGRLIVFPQTASVGGGAAFLQDASFRQSPLLPVNTEVLIDSSSRIALSPNVLRPEDWGDWVVARSLASLTIKRDVQARVLVSASKDRVPLVVSFPVGKGQITLIALDLVSQFLNVHPGVHRLFANILSLR